MDNAPMPAPLPSHGASSQYKDVRSLVRGLHVLKALNSATGGSASISEIAQACGLHRTTVKRIMETLRIEGFVRRGEKEGQYYLTFEVRRLSEGFVDDAWIPQVATPLMREAVRELLWPCDLSTPEGGFMVVRESTHRWSALSQHRAMIGEQMPMMVTALGRAYLAACTQEQRKALLDLLGQRTDWIGALARDRSTVDALIDDTQRRGYAINNGEWIREAEFGAVAVPVFCRGKLLAAMNIVFPKSAVSEAVLEHRYVPALQRLSQRIGKHAEAWLD